MTHNGKRVCRIPASSSHLHSAHVYLQGRGHIEFQYGERRVNGTFDVQFEGYDATRWSLHNRDVHRFRNLRRFSVTR